MWLGGQRRRGISLAARYADGWIMPGTMAGSVAYFIERREMVQRALEAAGRESTSFAFAGQVEVTLDAAGMRTAREVALGFLRAGADHVTLGIPGRAGPAGLGDDGPGGRPAHPGGGREDLSGGLLHRTLRPCCQRAAS